MGHRLMVIPLLALCLVISGCPSVVQDAYSTIVASKAFLDTAKKQHPECASGGTAAVCQKLKQATSAKDALIDVVEIVCAGPNFNAGGACDLPKKGTPGYDQAEAKIRAAIAAYNQAAADVKGAL